MGNEKPTTPKSNTAGKTLVVIAWVLLGLHTMGLIAALKYGRVRAPAIQAFLSQPSSVTVTGAIAWLIGRNLLAEVALVLGLTAWLYRKNKNGLIATMAAIIAGIISIIIFVVICALRIM